MKKFIYFKDIQDKIKDKLQQIVDADEFLKDKDLYLEQGFFNKILFEEIPGNIFDCQTCVPCVGLIDKKTGQVYLFAVGVILPDLDLKNLNREPEKTKIEQDSKIQDDSSWLQRLCRRVQAFFQV